MILPAQPTRIVLNMMNDLTDRKNRYSHVYSDNVAPLLLSARHRQGGQPAAPTPDAGLKPFRPIQLCLANRFGEDIKRATYYIRYPGLRPAAAAVGAAWVGPGEGG
jgi:hypothetical protein